ncbi:amidohydrolase family protein [Erythrobacter tepidarius]|uniref:amidohydrolase family protein n=1 Tax=Erythrobacter tepidarius TaxID=60454 RepID=UPI0013026603|nr:amidohydrolase family protein [Erythrobacter tepidarius]
MTRTFKIAGITLAATLLALLALMLWPSPPAPLPPPATGYLIRNVHVVDVENGTAGPLTDVAVRGGHIRAIGSDAPAQGLPVVDGAGGWLVPGFWDMHMHSFQVSPQLHLPLFVANGVVNVRDMMDCPGESDTLIACLADKRAWTRAAEAGQMTSPRFVEVASYYLEGPQVTPADVSRLALVYKRRGLDALKVYDRLSRPAYFRAAEEARRHGLRLLGHLPKAVALAEAVRAGQASIEHSDALPRHCFAGADDWRQGKLADVAPGVLARRMVEEYQPQRCAAVFAAMREAGTWLVPTHVTREEDACSADPTFLSDPRLDYLDPLSRWALEDDLGAVAARYPSPADKAALRSYFEHGRRLTGEAHRAGVRVLVGTDTTIGGFRYHDEMAHLVAAGLSPAEVLRAATIEAARYAGQERTAGSIAVGKRADLVLLRANPLEDIANTRTIEAVWMDGHHYDRALLDALLEYTGNQARSPGVMLRLLTGFARSSVQSDL